MWPCCHPFVSVALVPPGQVVWLASCSMGCRLMLSFFPPVQYFGGAGILDYYDLAGINPWGWWGIEVGFFVCECGGSLLRAVHEGCRGLRESPLLGGGAVAARSAPSSLGAGAHIELCPVCGCCSLHRLRLRRAQVRQPRQALSWGIIPPIAQDIGSSHYFLFPIQRC